MESKRVLIVGAGLAGLGAAGRLAERGVAVQVIEKRAQAGGSVFAVEEDGFVFESRPFELCATDHAMAGWLGALGLYGEWLPRNRFRTAVVTRGSVRSVDLESPLGIARIPGIGLREAFRTVRLPRLMHRYAENLVHAEPERAAAQDDRSLADFVRTYFGENVFERWALPWLRSYTSCDAYHTSRVLFVREFASRIQAPPAELRSGIAVIAREAAKRLSIQTNTEVSRAERSSGGNYRVTLRRGAEETVLDASAVICATGARTALQITQTELGFFEQRYLEKIESLPRAIAYFAMRGSLGDRMQRILVSARENDLLGTVFLQPAGASAHVPEGFGVVAVCPQVEWLQENEHKKDEEILDTISRHLQALFPDLQAALHSRRLLRLPEGSTQFQVGRYRDLAQLQRIFADRRAAGRRLYLAGDYLCGPMLEDALLSGLRAADAVFEDLEQAN